MVVRVLGYVGNVPRRAACSVNLLGPLWASVCPWRQEVLRPGFLALPCPARFPLRAAPASSDVAATGRSAGFAPAPGGRCASCARGTQWRDRSGFAPDSLCRRSLRNVLALLLCRRRGRKARIANATVCSKNGRRIQPLNAPPPLLRAILPSPPAAVAPCVLRPRPVRDRPSAAKARPLSGAADSGCFPWRAGAATFFILAGCWPRFRRRRPSRTRQACRAPVPPDYGRPPWPGRAPCPPRAAAYPPYRRAGLRTRPGSR